MTRPSLHEAATRVIRGPCPLGRRQPPRAAYRGGGAVARPGRRDRARLVAGARLHHAAARRTAVGHPAPAAQGHQRRPAAGGDAALDRRAAAGARQRLAVDGMRPARRTMPWRAAQQPLQILVCRASLRRLHVFVGLPRPIVIPRFGVRPGRASFTGRERSRDCGLFFASGRFSSPGASIAVSGSPNPSQAIGAPAVCRRAAGAGAQQPVRRCLHSRTINLVSIVAPVWPPLNPDVRIYQALKAVALTLMRRKHASRGLHQRFARPTAVPVSPITFTSSLPHLKSRANSSAALRASSLALGLACPST